MDQAIIKLCKELGCCDGCCLRYLSVKIPSAYENPQKYLLKYQDEVKPQIAQEKTDLSTSKDSSQPNDITDLPAENITSPVKDTPALASEGTPETEPAVDGSSSPPAKRRRTEYCRSCLGLLEEATWPDCYVMVKELLDKKGYDCETFACALSAPIATLLRERVLVLRLRRAIAEYESRQTIALKEAWKWSFGGRLSAHVGKALDSGAISPLLVTLNMEYPDDLQELEILKTLSPSLFESRSRARKRFAVEFTRRCVEQALGDVTLEKLEALDDVTLEAWRNGLPDVSGIRCVSVTSSHSPRFLGGRYIKLSRELPQTPWILNGKRMMESSVQEIIFQPIARMYNMATDEVEHRLKFMSAGREDVDVRCLGDGRPFAIEITDPRRLLTAEELARACEEISAGGKVVVKELVHVSKEALIELKKAEETKMKTYEALCIKLSHSKHDDMPPEAPPAVTARDVSAVCAYCSPPPGPGLTVSQRTPLRVLHRRPLLTRSRRILELSARTVPEHPQLLVVRLRTEAGTYVKEWVHGELGRTAPALPDALGAAVDILALDVARVHAHWPP